MKVTIPSRWKLGAMICCMVAGAYFLYISRDKSSHGSLSLENLKDSLVEKAIYENRTSAFSNWTKVNQLRNNIKHYSIRDSLCEHDKEAIKNIDEQLNQLLNERN